MPKYESRMNTPLISVVMSAYNEEKYIEESLRSILNQTVQDFEIIIFDDGSTDSTVEIINRLAGDDTRIKLVQNETNQGLTRNLNQGLAMAKGKYIARMDGDDISLPERFERQIEYLEAHPDTYLVSCQTETFGAQSMVWRLEASPEVLRAMMLVRPVLAHPGFMMRRELIDEGFTYDETYPSAQDYNLAVRVAKKHDIGVVAPVLLKYRTHQSQVSTKSGGKQFVNADRVRTMQLSWLGIELTEEENMWYHKFVREDKEVTPEAFEQVEIIIKKIVDGCSDVRAKDTTNKTSHKSETTSSEFKSTENTNAISHESETSPPEIVNLVLHELLLQWALRTHKPELIRAAYKCCRGQSGRLGMMAQLLRNMITHSQKYNV